MEKMRYLLIFSLLFGTVGSVQSLLVLHTVSAKGDVAAIRRRLESGDNVNLQDNYGKPPLHYAAGGGHVRAVRLLLDNGARLNIVDTQRHVPLVGAVEKRHKKVTRLLLAHAIGMDNKGGAIGELQFKGNDILINLVSFLNHGSMYISDKQVSEEGVLRWLNEVSKGIGIPRLGRKPSWEESYLEKLLKGELSSKSFELSDNSKRYLEQRKELVYQGLLKLCCL